MYKKIILLLLISLNLLPKTIIWDLGDTLFKTSRLAMAYDIGFWHFIVYMVFDLKSPNIQPIIFDILKKINPTSDQDLKDIAVDSCGNPLPEIMHKWLAGVISSQKLLKSVNCYLDILDRQKYFISKRQKRLVQKTLEAMFTPEILARNTYPIDAAITLLKDCYNAQDKYGRRKNNLMVLSNWDYQSFQLLKHKNWKIFQYFDENNIVISSIIGLIKPRRAAFEYLVYAFKLNPAECIFIDDQCINIESAQACGITGLLLCNQNYYRLRKDLVKLNVF